MASTLVGVVVAKLGPMINEEASLFLNFRKDFEWLSKKLTNLKGYIRDADAQSARNPSVKRWLLDVADIAWDAEDIIDEYAAWDADDAAQSSCVCDSICSQLAFRYKIGRRIKEVKDRLKSTVKDAEELRLVRDLTNSDQPSTSTSENVKWKWRGSSLIDSSSRPVAIESKVEDILRLLDDPATPVIAVVGMGGVGKTFLLQNVFNRVKDKFEKSIWLAVSQTYSLKKLQADMASEIKLKAGEEMKGLDDVVNGKVSEVQAAKLIHDHLVSFKSSLIVLDDVWRATGENDLISALGLPMGNNTHCKIVVTTRSRHVSSNMKAREYEVQPLSEEESWNLFCTFAFPDFPQNQPPQYLEGVARQIEGECGRLPLAVKIVAASLEGKRLSSEWESKLRHVKEASSTEDPIMQILKLCYDSLPADLKPCFAYLSFFPEDEEIDSQYLINLWVAEGYVPQGENQLDIGWNYLCDLHSLCLVERVRDIYSQSYGSFKLHDLLLDLAISISKESQCAFSVEEAFKRGPAVQTSSRYRRILLGKKSIKDGGVDVMESNRAYSASRLRTLSFSQNGGFQNIHSILLSGTRVLRVLDLSGTKVSSLPTWVGNLRLLRVLNLSRTEITEVPECVKSNKNLLFLDISFCQRLERLPEWIGELNCLEHLDITILPHGEFDGLMPRGISKLVSLQVLRSWDIKLSVEENEFLKLEHFVNLVNLREVSIRIHHEAELKSIEDGILATLVKMRNLSIFNEVEGHADVCNLPPLSEKMLAMKDLEDLWLDGFAVPNWICGFSNLMQLDLRCHCDEYPALEMMPNLIKLELCKNDICKALPKGFGKPGGFPQLRYFEIWEFSVLEELPELEDGAMPRLEILRVTHCPNVKKVPCGLEHLKSLKECRFPDRFKNMFKEGGELWNKMKANNPNVIINHQIYSR